jgi:hypothetical protein
MEIDLPAVPVQLLSHMINWSREARHRGVSYGLLSKYDDLQDINQSIVARLFLVDIGLLHSKSVPKFQRNTFPRVILLFSVTRGLRLVKTIKPICLQLFFVSLLYYIQSISKTPNTHPLSWAPLLSAMRISLLLPMLLIYVLRLHFHRLLLRIRLKYISRSRQSFLSLLRIFLRMC